METYHCSGDYRWYSQPLIATPNLTPNHSALLCLAMGGGGLAMSHINDAGY